ncbi:MAG: hypothetical protein MUO76_12550 [Anaerolineaceae bacterium]|nr:hypothetical protein [Anaerolineaceae bacterium]
MENMDVRLSLARPQSIPVKNELLKPSTALAADTNTESSSVISPVSQLAISHELQELSFSSDEIWFAYRTEDHSKAIEAHRTVDIQSRQERYYFDLTFSAEALGISADDFAKFGDGPIEFNFSFQHEVTKIQLQTSTSVHKTLRKPEEILRDLAKAIGEIMKDHGNKSISYVLDDEARQTIGGDPKMAKLLGELVMIMAVVNLMKNKYKPSNDYLIKLSGKGKPFIKHEEHLSVRQETIEVEFSFKINPPVPKVTASPEASSVPEQAENIDEEQKQNE